ncbi:hypothetical protein AVEN_89517-1 [Araneus ventricosus]|uniref:CCHC-type domain-containing protein n=1 Tax=Araneus ventricosus TaxID=182803 RepID=A0A4Y2KKX2_ARAVE|nr:hypothetical protein AVEN_89517-1 [Araneus ventricosus]
MECLKYQNVSAVKRISIREDGQYAPTKHFILSFNVPNLPQSFLIAYINCPVRPYVPEPLRCYKCEKFGHSVQSCRGHASNTCEAAPLCVNCKGDHPSYARSSPRWKDEKEIQAVKLNQNCRRQNSKSWSILCLSTQTPLYMYIWTEEIFCQ